MKNRDLLNPLTDVELAAANLITVMSPYGEVLRDILLRVDPRINDALVILGEAMLERMNGVMNQIDQGVN